MGRFSNVFESVDKEIQPKEDKNDDIRSSPADTNVSALDAFQDDQQKYGSSDPRSDKSVDHKYWLDLLWNAWHMDKSLTSIYYLLHGIRCGGGELTLTKDSFRLLQGEWSEKEWDRVKQENLAPVKEKLVSLLKWTRVGKVSDEQLPEGLFDGVGGEGMPAVEVAVGVEQERMFK